jgi:hypothetical protein
MAYAAAASAPPPAAAAHLLRDGVREHLGAALQQAAAGG